MGGDLSPGARGGGNPHPARAAVCHPGLALLYDSRRGSRPDSGGVAGAGNPDGRALSDPDPSSARVRTPRIQARQLSDFREGGGGSAVSADSPRSHGIAGSRGSVRRSVGLPTGKLITGKGVIGMIWGEDRLLLLPAE